MINSIDLYLFSVILSLSSLQSFKKHYKSKTQNDKQKTLDMGVSLILIHDSKSALRSVLNVYSERAGFQLADCMLLLCRRRSSQTDWLRGRERERETVSVTVWPLTAIYASPTWKWSSQLQSTLLQGNISTTDITTQGKAFSFTCLNSDLNWIKLGDFSLTFKNSEFLEFICIFWLKHFVSKLKIESRRRKGRQTTEVE